MDARYFVDNPLCPPQWRAERALRLVDHHPHPLRPQPYDDRYVRSYRRFLLQLNAACDDKLRRSSLFEKMPHVSQAYSLYISADDLSRSILEAWLLTGLSPAQISDHFPMDHLAIECFERLFFNVADRLDCSDWISKVIRGRPSRHSANADGQSGEGLEPLIRLFAFRGGPLVLRALVAAIAPDKLKTPVGADDIDESLIEHVRACTMQAAKLLSGHVKNVPALKKSLKSIRSKRRPVN